MIGLAKLARGPGNMALVDRDRPRPGAGEILLEVYGAGVCGTDLHIEAGEYPCDPPVVLGHEMTGRVVELGTGVDKSRLEAMVACESFYSTCGSCQWCAEGRRNLCPERRSLGTHVDGAFASHVVVPAENLHAVPEWLGDHAGALAEPLACVCQCFGSPEAVAQGSRALVTGPGPVGQLAAQVLRSLGCKVLITGLERDAARLETARDLGFEATSEVVEGEFDVVVEASGSAVGATTCLTVVRRSGLFVQVGLFGRPVELPFDSLLQKEARYSTGFASTPRAWRWAMQLIRSGEVELGALLSEAAPLREWRRVFADLRSGSQMKVVFDPRLP